MKHPAYSLRPNKAADRFILIDLLRCIGKESSLADFTYYGFGGPFLEDFKLIDEYFPEIRLVSIESSAHTYKRQEFHKFNKRIKLQKSSFDDFLTHDYEPGTKDIFWLDYTDFTYHRIQEFQRTISLVPYSSIIRITVQAELYYCPNDYRKLLSEAEFSNLAAKVKADFERTFGKVIPIGKEELILSATQFPNLVLLMLQEAAETQCQESHDREFLPIHSIIYNDHTQMLSLTGIVIPKGGAGSVKQALGEVHLASWNWTDYTKLDLPALSLKERLHLAPHLPLTAPPEPPLWDILKYNISDTRPSSDQALDHYANFHRHYPNFGKLVM